jgi:dipeptidyl aminopeptidase/acylaminoacyl peptidase
VAGTEFLKKTGYVDAKRIGITGGSYGGYMTLIALSKTPDVFAAGVDMFGIVNWWSMWERGSPTNRRYQEGLVGTPERNPDVYKASSPLTYLDQLKAPLLVLQGENDPLVPAHESRQVVEFLQKDQRTVEAHFYAGEGHGFVKPENQKDALHRTIDWFDRYLK